MALTEKRIPRRPVSNGDEGYPYGSRVDDFVGEDEHIYIHGAREGYKIDARKKCDKVFFAVAEIQPRKENEIGMSVKSVILFGRIRVEEDRKKVLRNVLELVRHIDPEHVEDRYKGDIVRFGNDVGLLEIVPEHLRGKIVHEGSISSKSFELFFRGRPRIFLWC